MLTEDINAGRSYRRGIGVDIYMNISWFNVWYCLWVGFGSIVVLLGWTGVFDIVRSYILICAGYGVGYVLYLVFMYLK